MLKTFNCGVGFCLIIKPKNLNKIKKLLGYKPITTRKSIVKFINQKY